MIKFQKSILIIMLLFITNTTSVFAHEFIIKTNDLNQLKKISGLISIEKFGPSDLAYWKDLYKISLTKKIDYQTAKELLQNSSHIKSLEDIYQAQLFSITPSANDQLINQKRLSHYQWSLKAQAQTLTRNLDQVTSQLVHAKAQSDINYNVNHESIEGEKPAVVAIIDTGVDLNHPELKDKILTNSIECNQTESRIDRDQNGYPADCFGWNFTRPMQDPRSSLPLDEDGHGTHIAGIIAAGSTNGIQGLNKNLKILPIKVLSNRQTQGAPTDRLALSVLYAINRGADVINFSMGWTKAMDTEYLRQAIQSAIQRNIIIVAASGNNSSNDAIYPCAYPNVICVGASSIDGEIASFSNYGGFVDVLAPGEQILSTIINQSTPNNFFVAGYDLKSGTSQASPFVAGLAAILKLRYPQARPNEISARIFESTRPVPLDKIRNKHLLHGIIDFERALNMGEHFSIKPTFKVMEQVLFRKRLKQIGIRLPIKNYWKPAKQVKIKIKSYNPLIELEKDEFILEEIKTNQVLTIDIVGNLKSIDMDNRFDFELKISLEDYGQEIDLGTYRHNVPIARFLDDDSEVEAIPFRFKDTVRPIGVVRDNQINPLIAPIVDKYHLHDSTLYYLPRQVDDQIELYVFKMKNNTYQELEKALIIPNATRILNFQVMPQTNDSIKSFFIRSIARDKVSLQEYIQYSYFDFDGNELFPSDNHWRFDPSIVLEDFERTRFVKFPHPKYKMVYVPFFSARSVIADIDQEQSIWSRPDQSIQNRLYYLEPVLKHGKTHLITRTFSTKSTLERLKKQINIDKFQAVTLRELMPQNKNDLTNGHASFILSRGRAFNQVNYIIKLEDLFTLNFNFKPLHQNYFDIENAIINPVISLSNQKADQYISNIWINFYDQLSAIDIFMHEHDQDYQLSHEHYLNQNEKNNHLLGFIAAFENIAQNGGREQFRFYQSRTEIIAIDHEFQQFRKKIIRFSFLPGYVFNQIFSPLTVWQGSNKIPALYVDGSQITTNHLEVISLSKTSDELIAPIALSVRVPNGCRPLAYGQVEFGQTNAYRFLCLNQNDGWHIKQLKLQL
jgi:hypothetical protein